MAEPANVLLGVFGGTFDPVHIGHLRTLLDVQQALELPSVHLIPNLQPPHREQPVLGAEQRFALLQKAISDVPGFIIDRREIEREGASYMVDTLRSLKAELPERHLCLIIGTDAYNSFCSWHQWQTILELSHLVVMNRANHDEACNVQLDARRVTDSALLQRQPAGLVYQQAVTQLGISSTRIRHMLRQGQSIQFLVPEIIRHELQTLYKG